MNVTLTHKKVGELQPGDAVLFAGDHDFVELATVASVTSAGIGKVVKIEWDGADGYRGPTTYDLAGDQGVLVVDARFVL